MKRLLILLAAAGALQAASCTGNNGQDPASQKQDAWSGVSQTGVFHLQVAPRDDKVPVGSFHHWTVRVLDANRQPVYPARIGVNGGMPGHGHGLPVQPQVTEYLGDGRYLIEGMKFNMTGEWVLVFGIESAQAQDRVQIEIELAH